VITFGRAVPHEILDGWDDDRFLRDNPLVQSISWENFASIWSGPHFEAYHPLHLLSYWIDVPIAGPNGIVIHAVSLVLWVLACWAVLEASWALKLGWIAGITCALIVALHPVQVEAVSWASGRKDVLALGFAALAVLMHARSGAPFDRAAWISRALYAAACLSKTTVLPLPLVLFAADRLLLDRDWRRALISQAPSLVIAIGLGAMTYSIWSSEEMIRGSELDFAGRVELVAATLTHHLGTAFYPAYTSPLYPIDRGEGFSALDVALGPIAILVVTALAIYTRDKRVIFAVIAFVVLIAPVANVVPLYFQWQDRYLSLPIWPIAFAVASLVERLWAIERRAAMAVTAVLAIALGVRTTIYSGVWSDRITLFEHAASVHPGETYAWVNLGHARRDAGRLESAVDAYERAIALSNLIVSHDSRFYATVLIDEQRRDLSPSRAEELTGRFHLVVEDAVGLRELAMYMAQLGYRRTVWLALDYSFALEPVTDDQLEQSAFVRLRRGQAWLADFYLSRMRRRPLHPQLDARVHPPEESPQTP
jgi:hypothetical protein